MATNTKNKTSEKPKSKRGGARQNSGGAREGAGRPTLYRPEFVDQLREFFSPTKEATAEKESSAGEIKLLVSRPPTFQRFAVEIGVTTQTLIEWCSEKNAETGELKYPEFAQAYAQAKDMQAAILFEGGVMKVYDAKMTAFALQVNHGWIPREEQTVTHHMNTSELDDVYQRGMAQVKELDQKNREDKAKLTQGSSE